jgi:radical SAM-linked protein
VKVQRLRICYSVTAEASELGQRDMVDAWTCACQDAGLPLAFSEGKRPTPHVSIAAPLPQGVTSTCELLDLHLSEHFSPHDILWRLGEHLPCGLRPLTAHDVGLNAPSVQSQVRLAEYTLHAPGADFAAVRVAAAALLSAQTLPSEYKREAKVRHYDLRPLIIDIRVNQTGADVTVTMRLRAEPERTARADQVATLLGFPEHARIERVSLDLEKVPTVLLSYRRLGERDE